MHKDFYASGFLYHPPTEQILLQQHDALSPTSSSSWSLFGGIYLEEEKPEVLFKNVIFKLLDIEISVVHPVYSYFDETVDKSQYVGYSTVKKLQNFSPKNGLSFAWFSFREVAKLHITLQMKHDIVVGQRVIEASRRKHLGQHTFQ